MSDDRDLYGDQGDGLFVVDEDDAGATAFGEDCHAILQPDGKGWDSLP